jgi:hypothetical protein
VKRTVVFFDEHLPLCIPAYFDVREPQKVTAVDKFLADFKPTHLGHGGDTMDLACISHWNKKKVRLIEGARLSDDFKMLNVLLAKHHAIVERSIEEYWYHIGNHEGWLSDLVDENPQALEGLVELEKATDLGKYGYKIIPRRQMHDLGGLGTVHGDFKDGYLPKFHAEAIAKYYHRDIAYGHCHTEQTGMELAPFGDRKFTATAVGTMSKLDPPWRKGQGDGHVNSFLVGYGDDDGNWQKTIVRVHKDGTFIFEGVKYQ